MPKPFQADGKKLLDFEFFISINTPDMYHNYFFFNPFSRINRFGFIVLLFCLLSFKLSAQLIINEVSQGPSGSKEWAELLVTGTPNCSGIPCVDLRGWYIDDNNGTFATGSGTGIANGCMRFTNDPLWACVPIGTIILIYNSADIDPAIPAQDLSTSDGNCRLVIPANNCVLLERNTTQPSTALSGFPTTGFVACGDWATVSMNNSFDSFQTRDPLGTLVHAVSWGNNTNSTIIYFSGTAGGTTMWMNNASNNNPNLQANWIQTPVVNETPGVANNPANAAWIATMNNNCSPVLPLIATGTSTNTCSCSGTATASPSGGISPYTYVWAPSGGNAATASSLCPGSYTCTITDVAGCTQTVVATVGAAPSPTVTITNQTNVSCNGQSNGTATSSATGGTGGYTYNWTPSGGTNAGATGLSADTYTITVTDANGCTGTAVVNITEPLIFVGNTTQTNVLCNGGNTGSATVTPSGGTGPYTYNWLPSGGTNATANNLTAGTYTCTVTDVNNCTMQQVVAITQPAPMTLQAGAGGTICAGGSIALNGTAGGSYTTVSWTGGTGTFSPPGSLSTVYTTGLGDNGNITLTITLTDACGNTVTDNVNVTVNPLPVAQLVAGGPTALCPGDSVLLTASGGTSYLWSTGATSAAVYASTAGNYSVVVSNSCGNDTVAISVTTLPGANALITPSGPTTVCAGDSVTLLASGGTTYLWSTGATTNSITVTTAGSYFVIATAACGNDTASQAVTIVANPVAQITASGPVSICQGDSVTLTANGGNNYLWSTGDTAAAITVLTGGNYFVIASASCGSDTAFQVVTVTPLPVASLLASGPLTFCQNGSVTFTASGGTNYLWSTGSTANSITVTTSGTYFVIVSNSCGSDTIQQVVTVLPNPVPAIIASGPLSFCVGGNVILTATGGGTYLWSTSATTAAITVNTSGTYQVAVTNACGTASTQVQVVVTPVPVISLSANGPTNFCAGSNVVLTASGGNTYLWSTGSTSNAITVNTAGTYSVVATNSCGSDTATQQITIQPLPVVQMSGGTVLCPGEQTTLTASGGTNYLWSNGNTGNAITVNTPGTYSVITSNSCGSDTATAVVTVSSVQAIFTASIDSGDVPLPVNFTNSSVNAISWNWDFGNGNTSSANSPTYTYEQPGVYTVILTVTNSDGCTDTTSLLITVVDIPVVIEIPNVFTPNGDNINDQFLISVVGLSEYNLQIYDRWGVPIGSISSPSNSWDGRSTSGNAVSDGTYYYVLTGTAYNDKTYSAKGFVQLIR